MSATSYNFVDADVIAIDDSQSELKIMEIVFSKLLPSLNVKYENHAYSLFPRLAIYSPKVLILDYCLKGFNLGDDVTIVELLKKYEGKIIVFSSIDEKIVRKKLSGVNFVFIQKTRMSTLIEEVKKAVGL